MPAHVAPLGATLPPDYFAPGVSVMHGQIVCSLWALAFYAGEAYRYERAAHGAAWVRVA